MVDLLSKARQLLPALAEVAKVSPTILLDRGQLARVVAAVSGRSLTIVKKYLPLLEGDGAVVVRQTPGGTIEKLEVVGQLAEKKAGGAVVLWDYENTRKGLEEKRRANGSEDLRLNFRAIMAHLVAKFGAVLRAEAFLPPHLSGNENLVRSLLMAGFQSTACPQRTFDKDAADVVLCQTARFHLAPSSGIEKIIVVSGDQDFRQLLGEAANVGKEVVIYDLLGVDGVFEEPSSDGTSSGVVELRESPGRRLFLQARDEIVSASPDKPLSAQARLLVAMVGKIKENEATLVRAANGGTPRYPSFKPLLELLVGALRVDFEVYYFFTALKDALAALIEVRGGAMTRTGVLEKFQGAGFVAYKLTSDAGLLSKFTAPH